MKKHILVVSQYFYPESFRINDMCVEWVKRGYKVTVITGIPNYPAGEFYEGYDKNHKRLEEWNGIEIVRIPIAPRKKGAYNLMKNYLSFVWSGFWWNKRTSIKADYVFIFEVSPMTQALVGVWYANKHKIPCYLYVQDLWPENVEIVTGISNPLVIKPISWMVNYIYKKCTHIFGTSPSFVEEIQKRCRNKEKVSYWPQYAEDFYHPIEKKDILDEWKELTHDNDFKICFTGNIGQAQGLEILPKVAPLLRNENIKFVIVGDGRGKSELEQGIKDNAVADMFVLIDRQVPEKIPALLSCCDAAFISFMDNELFAKTIPAKLQSYMACGMPVVAVASGETERIIRESNCGVCSDIGCVTELANNIRSLKKRDLHTMGINSRRYFEKNFLKSELMDEIQIYFN